MTGVHPALLIIEYPASHQWLLYNFVVLCYTAPLPKEFADFQDCVTATTTLPLPRRTAADHAIDLLPGTTPPYGPIYPLSQAELEVLRRYLDDALAKGWIRKSISAAGAPILFVPKKSGELRLCVDYRALNRVTEKNRYPLPLISEILDRLSGAKYFTKLDLKDAFHRIRIREGDEWKTAFRTRYGHFEYLVMPFGLTNAPATFQSYIHQALHGLLDEFCITYVDDILIFSSDRDSHTKHVRIVLEGLEQSQLFINSSKCSFYQDRLHFLGFVVSREGISMDPERVRAIAEWPIPRTYRDIQVFLGFCNFYRRFIYRYSSIAAPLNHLLKGSVKGKKPGSVELTDVEAEAFHSLVGAFQHAPVLRHFDPQLPIRVETDASNLARAAILSQPDPDGHYHPVAFWSSKFKDAETRYGTPDKEMMAIVDAFKQWRHYLEGSTHTIEALTDHQNLRSFMRQPKLNGRQARWYMYLAPFDFEIKHQAGARNPADAPSRRPDYGPASEEDVWFPTLQAKMTKAKVFQILSTDGALESRADPRGLRNWLQPRIGDHSILIQSLRASDPEVVGDAAIEREVVLSSLLPRALVRQCFADHDVFVASFEGSPDLLQLVQRLQEVDPEIQNRISEVSSGSSRRANTAWTVDDRGLLRYKDRIWIPPEESVKAEILQRFHDDPLSGHFGVNRTEELIQRQFQWKGMRRDIQEYVSSCAVCQRTVSKRHLPYGSLVSLPKPNRPWSEVSMDFVTGLPEARVGFQDVDSVFVVVDRYTRMARFCAVSTSINAAELARLFHTEIELKFGAPNGIVSDRGSIFTSDFWSELAYQTRIKLRLSTAFHPQTDGQTERMNQVLEHYLRCLTHEYQHNWPQLLPTAEFAINNAVNSSTNVSPFRALMGYDPELRQRVEADSIVRGVPAVTDRLEKLREVREKLEDHARRASESQAKYYNRKHKPQHYKRGDLVMLSTKKVGLQNLTSGF